jgi:hypothetical protein
VQRAGKATRIKVPGNRRINVARVRCPDGTCTIRRIQVRYNLGGGVFNGKGSSASTVPSGGSATVRSNMPAGLYRRLAGGRTGTVTAVVTVTSSNGTRVTGSVRTGLRR